MDTAPQKSQEHDHAHDHSGHDHSGHNHAEHDHAHDHTGHDHSGHNHAHDHAGHDHAGHAHDISFDAVANTDIQAFLETFMHLAVEFSLLFLSMSILMSFILAYVPQKKIQSLFAASYGRGTFFAMLFAALTPMCTFSTVPMLQGLLRAKVNFGSALTFLLCSPMLSPVIVALMFSTFGWYFTACYILLTGIFAIGTSFCLQKWHFDRYLIATEGWQTHGEDCCSHAHISPVSPHSHSFWCNARQALMDGLKNFKQALPYLLMGIMLGALVHSFAPQSFLVKHAGQDSFASLGLAALIGLPLHVHLETIIPASKALLEKGLGLGALMAFFVASGGMSLTGLIVLKSVFKTPLLVAITLAVFLFALATGFIFPWLMA